MLVRINIKFRGLLLPYEDHVLLSLQTIRWSKAQETVLAESSKFKVGDFTRDATALLLSWILAQRSITAVLDAGGTVGGRLKEWDDEMNNNGWTTKFSDWDIGSTLCEHYLEPKAWAPVCDELFTVLEEVVQVVDTPHFNVDDALVEFLVGREVILRFQTGSEAVGRRPPAPCRSPRRAPCCPFEAGSTADTRLALRKAVGGAGLKTITSLHCPIYIRATNVPTVLGSSSYHKSRTARS